MSARPDRNPVEGLSARMGLICLLLMGPMFFLLMPLYVGALVDHLHVSDSRAGVLASLELLGTCAASLLAMFWIRRLSWRRVGVASAALLVVGNLLCLRFGTDVSSLIGLRLVTGFAAGNLVSLATAGLGDTRHPDRNFAYAVIGQLALSGALFMVLPNFIAEHGATAVFGCFAVCALLAVFGAMLLPETGREHAAIPLAGKLEWKPLWGLLGGAAFFVANTAVWAYIERIGVASGLDSGFIGRTLGFGILASILGPLLAAWVGDRFDRFHIMLVSLLGELACLAFLKVGMDAATYAAVVLLYQFFWNLWIPFQMGVVATTDTSGRFAVLIPLFQAGGVALGPALAAAFLVPGSYLAVNVIGAGFAILALILFVPVTRGHGGEGMSASGEAAA